MLVAADCQIRIAFEIIQQKTDKNMSAYSSCIQIYLVEIDQVLVCLSVYGMLALGTSVVCFKDIVFYGYILLP